MSMLTSSSLAWKNQREKKRKQEEREEDDENKDKNMIKWFEK